MADSPPRFSIDFTGAPLDDCRALLGSLPAFDAVTSSQTSARLHEAALGRSRAGRLAHWMGWLAGWLGASPPANLRVGVHVFVGHNGWNGGSGTTRALHDLQLRMVALSSGGAAASALAGAMGAGLHLYDLASTTPSGNAQVEDGTSEIACARALAFGLECVRHDSDILVVKAIGAGAREVAATLALVQFGGTAADWLAGCEPDFGTSFSTSEQAVEAMAARVARGQPDALEQMRRAGAREIAAAVGAIVAARAQRLPVIIEGFAATMALALVHSQQAGAADHCLVAASDGTPGHDQLCRLLNQEPVMDLQMAGIDAVPGLMAAQTLRSAALMLAQTASRAAVSALLEDRPVLTH